MLKKIFQDKYFYIIAIIAIVFVIIKIPHLSLPYYWDEAFGYSVAVRYMYDHGLSLLPNAINPYLSVGHPILFHFFEASWMKIFGTSLVAAKSFPLTISVLLIFSIYYFCKKFFNRIIGVASIIIFCSQEIFIAQASFVLLEVMLTFFTITTLYFYFSRKQDNSAVSYYDLLYILSALLLSLTKESGMILIMVLVLWQFIELITDKEKRIFKSSLKEFIILISPLILVSAYYIAQKITYGWFFYPLHIELMSNKWTTLHFELSDIYSPILYQKFGRIIMTIASAIALVFYFITKNKPEKIQIKIIIVFALFLIFFQFYSSVNFFSTRYILCEFPVYIIICSYFIFTAFRQYKPLAVAITITIIAVKLYSTYTERNDADSNLGFVDAVTVQKRWSIIVNRTIYRTKLFMPIF